MLWRVDLVGRQGDCIRGSFRAPRPVSRAALSRIGAVPQAKLYGDRPSVGRVQCGSVRIWGSCVEKCRIPGFHGWPEDSFTALLSLATKTDICATLRHSVLWPRNIPRSGRSVSFLVSGPGAFPAWHQFGRAVTSVWSVREFICE